MARAEDWDVWLGRLRLFRKRHGHGHVPVKYPTDPDLARWVAKQRQSFHRLDFPQIQKLWSLGFHFGPDQNWISRFLDLVEFQRQHGHCNVPTPAGPIRPLGLWLSSQRPRRHTMSLQRRTLLDNLGIEWSPIEAAWNRHFADLKAFKAKYRHCRVPAGYAENPQLSIWVENTRHRKRGLGPVRRRLLDKLGFDWDPLATLRHTRLKELTVFHRRFGHCDVPAKWEENPSLGNWIADLRRQGEQHVPSFLRRSLRKLGFAWASTHDRWWENRFEELEAFKRRFGHCNVPKDWEPNRRLGNWISTQRNQREVMPPERRRKLDRLGFEWKRIAMSPREPWQDRFDELLEYRRRHGNCEVPNIWGENQALASWVGRQRRDRAKLPVQKRKQLEAVGFCWDIRQSTWDHRFDELKEYKRRHGDCNVSRSSDASPRLCGWVFRQRNRKHTLGPDRIRKLDDLGFVRQVRLPRRHPGKGWGDHLVGGPTRLYRL